MLQHCPFLLKGTWRSAAPSVSLEESLAAQREERPSAFDTFETPAQFSRALEMSELPWLMPLPLFDFQRTPRRSVYCFYPFFSDSTFLPSLLLFKL